MHYCQALYTTDGLASFRLMQEEYNSLTNKTVAFLKLITTEYDPKFVVKVDDDVYLRVDRLPYAVKQWTAFNSGMSAIEICTTCE